MALQRISVVLLLLMASAVPAVLSIYVVPEHARFTNELDTLEVRRQGAEDDSFKPPSLAPQGVGYPMNSTAAGIANDKRNGNGQTNALLAETSRLRHHTSYDKSDDVAGANGHNNNSYNKSVASTNENENAFENVDSQTTAHDEHERSPAAPAHDASQRRRSRRELADWLIAPNTRWCGRGNTANGTYNHLGGASRADKCCRKHDHCKLYIPAMSNRFGLFNYLPYTLSHCNCDRRFRTCLKMANDEDANAIGKFFFNMVDTQCFVLIKENICQARAADGTCTQEQMRKKAYLRKNRRY